MRVEPSLDYGNHEDKVMAFIIKINHYSSRVIAVDI